MAITRRAVTAGVGAAGATAATLGLVASLPAAAAPKVFPRLNASTDEGKKALDRLGSAISFMRKRSLSDQRSYSYLAGIHGVQSPWGSTDKGSILSSTFSSGSEASLVADIVWNTCVAHYPVLDKVQEKKRFLPWHRMYLLNFEKAVQYTLKDDTFRVPYWNWCFESDRSLPRAFIENSSLLNSKRASRSDPISRGLTEVPYVDVNNGERIDGFYENSPNIQNYFKLDMILSVSDFVNFSETLDSQAHGLVHNLVGGATGDMAKVPQAAYDPVFWVHHANIDRLWAIWQTKNPHFAAAPDWLDQVYSFIDVEKDTPTVLRMKVSDVIDTTKLLYTYDDILPGPNTKPIALAKSEIARSALNGSALSAQALQGATPLPATASLTAPAATITGTAPVRMVFTAKEQGVTLRALLADATDERPLLLRLERVEASSQPGVLYPLLLDQPEAAAADDSRIVAHQVFFDNVVPRDAQPGQFGSDFLYNITNGALALLATNKLADTTTLTILPSGDPSVTVTIDGATISLG